MINRLDPQELRSRLFDEKSWSKKELGQHFLIDASVLAAVVDAARISKEDTVVEIGPGMGVLTEKLLEKAGRVIAFEFDEQMQKVLRSDFPSLELVPGDVLRTAPEVVSGLGRYKVVANIPYQITTPLMKLFLEGGVSVLPEQLVFLVQKEVGQRLAAPAGSSERGYLSVLIQYYADVRYVRTVPREAFWPAPAVESAVISLHIRQERPFSGKDESDFLRYVKAASVNPRKQLKNVLGGMRGISQNDIAARFAEIGLPDTARAQELSQEQWAALFKAGI